MARDITPDLEAKLLAKLQVGDAKPQGEIEIDYVSGDGSTALIVTADTWKALELSWQGGVVHAEPAGWKATAFDDSAWDPVVVPDGPSTPSSWVLIPDATIITCLAAWTALHNRGLVWLTRYEFSLTADQLPDIDGVLAWAADNAAQMWLNGTQIVAALTDGESITTGVTTLVDKTLFVEGVNVLAVKITNESVTVTSTWAGNPTMLQARLELSSRTTVVLQASRIAIDRSRKTAAAQLDADFSNETGDKGWYTQAEPVFVPNNPIRAYVWLGDRANRVLRYTGLTEQFSEHRDPKTISVKALSRTRILLDPHLFLVTAPQDAATTGAVRTEDNGVYIGKSPEYIAGDILDRAGWPAAARDIAISGITIPEYDLSDGGQWLDQIVGTDRLTTIAGWDYREDAAGVIHLGPNKLQATDEPDPDWTFTPGVNVMAFDHQSDDAARVTRVRVSGPMTSAVPIWKQEWATSAIRRPVGLMYRPSEPGFIYTIDALTKYLSKIDQATRKVVAKWNLSASFTHYPVGLSVDPTDASTFYALDGDWPIGGTTHAKVRKFTFSTKALAATTNLPDGEWSAMKFDGSHLWLTNYGDDKLYKKTFVGGGTAGATANYSYAGKANPTGLWLDGTTIGIHFAALEAFYLVDTSAPGTITSTQSTKGTGIFGGEMDTTTHADLYVDHYTSTAGSIKKFALTEDVTSTVVKWASDQDLEDALGFQAGFPGRVHDLHPDDDAHPWDARIATVELRTINSPEHAQAVADAELVLRKRIRRVLDLATTGHPGVEIDDAIGYPDVVAGTDAIWMIDTAREQLAETYTQTMSVLPWEAPA